MICRYNGSALPYLVSCSEAFCPPVLSPGAPLSGLDPVTLLAFSEGIKLNIEGVKAVLVIFPAEASCRAARGPQLKHGATRCEQL